LCLPIECGVEILYRNKEMNRRSCAAMLALTSLG
jgi:hypothetical protein